MFPDHETEAAVRATLRAALEQLQETVDLPAGLLVVEPAKPEHRSAVLQTRPDGGYHLRLWGGHIVSFNDTQESRDREAARPVVEKARHGPFEPHLLRTAPGTPQYSRQVPAGLGPCQRACPQAAFGKTTEMGTASPP